MKRFLALGVLLLSLVSVYGQLNTVNYIDNLNGYYAGVDTQFQLFNEIKTTQEQNALIAKYFPFNTNQFLGSYSKIQFTDTLTPKPDVDFPFYISWGNASNYFRAQQLRFNINQDTGFVFCYKNKSVLQNPKTAYIIIPGSGINQATGIAIYNPANYHNVACIIAQKCLNYGDVFTYVRPNEDFASFWTTVSPGSRKKLGYQTLTSVSNLNNKNWAANCFIQINALTKYLQGKYDKVVILGLSSGAWGAMFSALQSEPDAAVMASGYSINFHDLTYTYTVDQLHYDGLFANHPIDSVRNRVRTLSTQMLFSYGSNDPVTHMQEENTVNTTQNYFNSPSPATNTSFFYNFSLHRFPCEALDTFFTRIAQMPKAKLEQANTCTSDSLVIRFSFKGVAPFQGILYRNNIPYQGIYSDDDTLRLSVSEEGVYELKNFIDSHLVVGFKTQALVYTKTPALQVGSLMQQYNCSLDSTEIQLPINGTPPFAITTFNLQNNTINSVQSNSNSFSSTLSNGTYQITQISDSNQCTWQQLITFQIENHPIQVNISNPVFNCDSNKNQITIHTQGKTPWQISYFKSGTPLQLTLVDTLTTLTLNNGLYLFLQAQDGNGCTSSLNQANALQGMPIQTTVSPAVFECDSNKTKIDIQAQGNGAFTLHYTKDNNPQQVSWQGGNYSFFFDNGNYHFSHISDNTQCTDSLNLNLTDTLKAINANVSSPVYDCDSNKTRITFTLQGNAPWVLMYTLNGMLLTDTLTQVVSTRYYNNGLYQFLSVSDSTHCVANINQSYNVNYQTLSWNLNQQGYDCNTNLYKTNWSFTGNLPLTLNYTLNGSSVQTQTFTTFNADWFLGNGNYQVLNIVDNTGCSLNINLPLTLNYNPIAVSLTTPIYDCDSNKTRITYSLQGNSPWVLNYTLNGMLFQDTLTQAMATCFYPNGLYQFLSVSDSTNCLANINQSFNFNNQVLSWNLNQQGYDCNTNLYKTSWSFTGNLPISVNYTLNGGSVQTKTFNTLNDDWFLGNGNYQLLNINDNTGCNLNLNIPLTLNYTPLAVLLSTPMYDCDSNKTRITYNLQGNSPWVLHYTLNGIPFQDTLTQAITSRFYPNGLYQFLSVSDSTNCLANINQSYSFNYQALSWNLLQQGYNCDSNLYALQFQFTGNAPWTITYELNGGFTFTKTVNTPNATLFLPNGQWQLVSVSDATGCTQAITLPLTLNFNAINVSNNLPQYDCDSNKMRISYGVQGNAPFSFMINQLNTNTTFWLTTNDNNPNFWLTNGQYTVMQMSDATGCVANINQYINHNLLPLAYQQLPRQFDCDSQKIRYPFVWQGNAPFILNYRDLTTGVLLAKTFLQNNGSLWLSSGHYQLLSVSDAYCTVTINDTLHVNFPAIQAQVNTPGILCDSNKARLDVTVQSGLFPMYLHWIYNGMPDSLQLQNGAQTKLLNNGTYYFQTIRDSVGCIKTINTGYTANYRPLQWQGLQWNYECTTDTHRVAIDVHAANNTAMYFTKNAIPDTILLNDGINSFAWGRGTYKVAFLRDSAQCILPIDAIWNLQEIPVSISVDTVVPNCNFKKHEYHFNLQGKAPWLLTYNYLNTLQQITFNDSTATWLCEPGRYDFLQIRDANTCTTTFNRIDSLPRFLETAPELSTDYKTLQINPSNLPIQWFMNQQALASEFNNQSIIRHSGSGDYQAMVTDDANCNWLSNSITLSFDSRISLYPNPASDEIGLLVQDVFGDYWTWTIHDAQGRTLAERKVHGKLDIIQVGHWQPGVYSVRVLYQNSPNARVLRFIKE